MNAFDGKSVEHLQFYAALLETFTTWRRRS